MTDRSAYYKARRDRLRGGPARTPVPAPCGTWAAVMRHYRAGVRGADLDELCRKARDEHNAEQYRRRKEGR